MSETLLSILLVTSSAKGPSLVYRWPPSPSCIPRLARPLPNSAFTCSHADNPWRAANDSENTAEDRTPPVQLEALAEDDDYVWKRPNAFRDRSLSFSHSRSHPTSRRASPSKDACESFADRPKDIPADDGEYDTLLGYSAEFLAGLLSPQSSMCHQKFELVVDDLAFLGHPVCADKDGGWRFKPAQRGRGSKKGRSPEIEEKSLATEKRPTSWLQTFHFVIVLDLPDPSSSAAGNITKYFDTIYEHIAFKITAVLFREQILHNFVEAECDILGALKDEYATKGAPFAEYMAEALKSSSIAPAIKTLYEAIKEGSIARLTINEIPLELQLPPYLDASLHVDEDIDAEIADPDEDSAWGPEMSFAWRLSALTPWKSLLRLGDEGELGYELYRKLQALQLSPENRELAEQLMKFFDLASMTLSLADMASLLDWDLDSQVFPIVRWLVLHRRAKLVDIVHPGLKTVFTVSQKFPAPLAELSAEFARAFAHASVPPLPKILATVSTATHRQGANHFFATVVGTRDLLPLYHDVVAWMLKRDLLVTLHLRVRIVASEELKNKVDEELQALRAKRKRKLRARALAREPGRASPDGTAGSAQDAAGLETVKESSPIDYYFSLSPRSARRHTRQLSPSTGEDKISPVTLDQDAKMEDEDDENDDAGELSSSPEETKALMLRPSVIADPARAKPLERRWIAAMSEGKDPYIARRFEKINQYFDGKCTDDEILFRAEISRKQLREVLHHYEEYLQTFLHPS